MPANSPQIKANNYLFQFTVNSRKFTYKYKIERECPRIVRKLKQMIIYFNSRVILENSRSNIK